MPVRLSPHAKSMSSDLVSVPIAFEALVRRIDCPDTMKTLRRTADA